IVEIGLLGKKSDLRLHARIVQFHAQNAGAASGREDQTHEHLQRRSFSRAVRAQETEYFAILDCEMEGMQSAFRTLAPKAYAVALFQCDDFNRVHTKIIAIKARGAILPGVSEREFPLCNLSTLLQNRHRSACGCGVGGSRVSLRNRVADHGIFLRAEIARASFVGHSCRGSGNIASHYSASISGSWRNCKPVSTASMLWTYGVRQCDFN